MNFNDKVELFPCYSHKLKDFLLSNGFKYELVGLNPKSKRKFFVFVENEQFKKVVDLWNESKL